MPEQLTRHPEETLQVLKSAGAQCGTGAPQAILKACPPARFCKLPGGEICVYGLADAPRMTQLGPADWQALAVATGVPGVAPPAGAAPASAPSAPASTTSSLGASAPPVGASAGAMAPPAALASAIALVALGAAIGWVLRRPP